jgi:hypothetical protein
VLRNFQLLFVFDRQGQQPLHGSWVVNLFGEATASGDLLQQTDMLAINLIGQSRHTMTLGGAKVTRRLGTRPYVHFCALEAAYS